MVILGKTKHRTLICLCNYRHPLPRRVWKGGSEQQFLMQKHVDNDNCHASSRRLDLLHTSATSPLMKASRRLDFVGRLRASATFSKRVPRGFQKDLPGTISSSNYFTNSRSTALSGRYLSIFTKVFIVTSNVVCFQIVATFACACI